MTTLKRVMVSLPPDLEAEIYQLSETPDFQGLAMSQILRRLIRRGLDAMKKETGTWTDES